MAAMQRNPFDSDEEDWAPRRKTNTDVGKSSAQKKKTKTEAEGLVQEAPKGSRSSGPVSRVARAELGLETPSKLRSRGISHTAGARNRHQDELQSKSVEELQAYAMEKSQETTACLDSCLRVAHDIKGNASQTLETLHSQREQVQRMHEMAFHIDQNLSTGEKLLGSLGGMFSRSWKPRRGPSIKGPVAINTDDIVISRIKQPDGGLGASANRHNSRVSGSVDGQHTSPTSQSKLEMEREKQDDALSTLSNVLDEMKGMSLEIGAEISRQSAALEHFQSDVITLDDRVQGANTRGRRLLGS